MKANKGLYFGHVHKKSGTDLKKDGTYLFITMLQAHNCYNTSPFTLSGRTEVARVVDVYDGDTITAIIELYPTNFCQFKFRLANIDTPEMLGGRRHEATLARNRTIFLITGQDVGKMSRSEIKEFLNNNMFFVHIKCMQFEKYGRVLAHVYPYGNMDVSINETLVAEGHAQSYMVKADVHSRSIE